MQYSFPYDYLPRLDIPDDNLIGIYEAGQVKPSSSPDTVIRRALENPIGAPTLSDIAGEVERVLILCDDNTRYTPAYLVLPPILSMLRQGGVSDDRIGILIASGTHRIMTRDELAAKLGKAVVDCFNVEQHSHDDPDELIPTGKRINDVEFLVNRRLQEADLIIGIGNIVPHMYKGFSGGSNIILPGVSGESSIAAMHWLSLETPVDKILGVRDNPVRKLIDEIARRAGLNYIVNTIVNNDMEILDVVAGDPVEAHRKGAKIASEVFTVDIPKKADIVIFDAYKNDLDFWQANKGFNPAYICMKRDGVIIMVANCSEGVCHNIPEISLYGFKDVEKIMKLYEEGMLNPISAHFLIATHRLVAEHGRCISVTRGISRKQAEQVGFIYAETPQEALEKAFAMKGSNASVTVLRHAGNICPRIGK